MVSAACVCWPTVNQREGQIITEYLAVLVESRIRDAPLDFKGGTGSLGQDKFFFFSSLARKVFLFSVPNGASFFFF